MTPELVREAVATYRSLFERMGIAKAAQPHDTVPSDTSAILEHCHSMLDGMDEFVTAGDTDSMEKAFRWLGFIQGCLYSCRVYTINALKYHNKH